MKEKFFIKENYKHNVIDENPVELYTSAPIGTVYQVAVFEYIRAYIKKNSNISSVIDFGCGSAYKLNKYIADLNVSITGVDQKFIIDEIKDKFTHMNFRVDDFSDVNINIYDKFDLIISSDVIEHLVDPDLLLDRIKASAHQESVIFISTPERDLVRGKAHNGPSPNLKHVREWNMEEFRKYISSRGFTVQLQIVLPAKQLTLREKVSEHFGRINNNTCQLIVCKYSGK
jgi:2-polyprenyl-3-methyl-5-hydroxy-6-metoxy-1,4-benzoquinol methylase